MTTRRFRAPWTVEQVAGGFKVVDADGHALAYVYARDTAADAHIVDALAMPLGETDRNRNHG